MSLPTPSRLAAALRLAEAIRACGVVIVDRDGARHLETGSIVRADATANGRESADVSTLVATTNAPVVFVVGAVDAALGLALDAVACCGTRVVNIDRSANERSVVRATSAVAASLLLLLLAPVLLVLALVVRLDSVGPSFFTQKRIGRNGRRFRIPKLRSMATTAEPYARSPHDMHPALTRVGRWLRPTGLDELPQLTCVVMGTMAFVGPRPEMPFVVARYTPMQRLRLLARPGITGLWQLRGDRSRAIHEQIEYDLAYLACRSVTLDLHMLLETVRYALRVAPSVVRSADDVPETG